MNLARIRPVFDAEGPYVTVHAEVGRASENADEALHARWTSIRQELERQSADPQAVALVGERLLEPTGLPGEVRRTVVVAGTDLVLDDVQAGHTVAPEAADVGDLPDLSGWLRTADGELPFVLVVADREGADLAVYRALDRPAADTGTVQGETFHITKVPEGDWAQKQFQQNAENAWHRNATEVAEAVRSLEAHRPVAVFVAGDVRARNDIAQQLTGHGPVPEPEVIELSSGGRAEGASDEAMWHDIQVALADLAARRDQDVADRLAQARGQGAGAAFGVDAVLDALGQRQVEQLVLDPDRTAEQSVTPRSHPGLSLPPTVPNGGPVPADRALVAAAALSGASLALLPADLVAGPGGQGADGAAALLRWSN